MYKYGCTIVLRVRYTIAFFRKLYTDAAAAGHGPAPRLSLTTHSFIRSMPPSFDSSSSYLRTVSA